MHLHENALTLDSAEAAGRCDRTVPVLVGPLDDGAMSRVAKEFGCEGIVHVQPLDEGLHIYSLLFPSPDDAEDFETAWGEWKRARQSPPRP